MKSAHFAVEEESFIQNFFESWTSRVEVIHNASKLSIACFQNPSYNLYTALYNTALLCSNYCTVYTKYTNLYYKLATLDWISALQSIFQCSAAVKIEFVCEKKTTFLDAHLRKKKKAKRTIIKVYSEKNNKIYAKLNADRVLKK